ncbi:MAG: response regulator transcription factor [Solirubrobacteraceae bacterium]|nr:response regulator transcription factor [Solirubrobacteraceae bacterium]
MIRVAIADDQAMIRAGLRSLLEREADITVVGEAADGDAAVRLARRTTPDVMLIDIRMPGTDGITATREISAELPGTRMLVVTTFDLDEYVFGALQAGASGFLLKDVPASELVAAVRVVAAGDGLLAPAVTRRVIEAFASRPTPSPPPGIDELTPRELEVLGLVARGRSNAELAEQLVIAESTVKTHLGQILMKLGARDRVQAVIAAYEAGLVVAGDR